MTIQFMCPNGHTLSAPEHQAGKEGKCPKCESAFLVPDLEEFASLEDEFEDVEEADSEPDADPPAAPEKFFFLCPNGHKLSGPPSLKGKPGQCPHCESRFMIPSDEDGDEEEVEVEMDTVAEPVAEPKVDFAQAESPAAAVSAVQGIPTPKVVNEPMAPPIEDAHQLGAIFYQLNSVLDEDRVIELQMDNDETIVADKIALTLSQSEYAVLSRVDEDEVTSIITVPWSSVKRATIRKVTELPDGWFR